MAVDDSVMSDSDNRVVVLSVVLPTRNGADHIRDQLASIARQEWDGRWELVVVDNGSTDSTPVIVRDWIASCSIPTRLVTASDHFSLAHARNVGVDASTGRSVAFVDDDDVLADGWVAAIGACLSEHALVGSSFEYESLNDSDAARARGTFQQSELGQVLGIPVVSGGGSGCHRSLWEQLGGNRLDFYRSGEDIDFSLRATIHAGVEPVLCHGAVYHVRLREDAASAYRQAYRFARAAVRQYRLYGTTLGARPESFGTWIRRLGGLVFRLPQLRSPGGRLSWTWQLGTRVGRLAGSFAERVWYP